MATLLALLSSKLLWSIVGPLIAAVLLYYKGYQHGSQSTLNDARDVSDKIKDRIQSAEASNLNIEKQAQKQNETVSNASTIDELISVFNALQSKDSSSPSDKNPK